MTHPSFSEIMRRDLLKIGGLGMLGLTVPRLLEAAEKQPSAPKRTAKSVVFLYQFGGPSHPETFDMKPQAPTGLRSHFGTIESSVPGLRVCEHLPETAKIMNKVTLIRSMYHRMKNHNSASYYALTGFAPPVDDIRLRDTLDLHPAYGSVANKFLPPTPGMPTFVAYPHVIRDGAITPGQHASFLGKEHDPLLVTEDPNGENFKLPELSLPANLSAKRLNNRRMLQTLIDRQSRIQEFSAKASGLNIYYQKALSMLQSPKVRRAFDLSKEPEKLRNQYGRTTYGQSLLLARRLVEAGVGFVNVYFSKSIGGQKIGSGGWDTHGFNNTRMYPILKGYHLPITDQTLPTFLNDLDQRGLLDETLVVWMGEFGRTPKINKNISRDHWPQCYTVLLAGGGIKRGYIHGASDKNAAYPARDGVRPEDLAATMFSALGINPRTEVRDKLNRPLPIAGGQSVSGVFA
ncbi:MAG: DUF1501 domain-containing protein [Planctomycetaceae bacterium]